MEKHTQDKSSLDDKSIRGRGQDEDRFEQGYGSFNEEDYDKKPQDSSTLNITPGGTVTGSSDKANIKSTLNENDSTISNTSAPSKEMSEEDSENEKE